LKGEYEKLKAELESATDNTAYQFNKKKAMMQEMKLYSEQKAEVLRHQKLIKDKVLDIITFRGL
jgi:structural maintenance of chromosome 1